MTFSCLTLTIARGGLAAVRRELSSLPVWGLFAGQIGVPSDQFELILATDAPELASAEVVKMIRLDTTVRPTSSDPLTGSGVFAHRWFEIEPSDWEEFLALSEGAWPGFEAANDGVRVHGFFRVPDDPRRVLLVTRYPDLAGWEASRNADDDAGGANFRRRHQLTVSTVVRTYRLIA